MANAKRESSLLAALLTLHLQGLRRGAEMARAVQQRLLALQHRLRARLMQYTVPSTRGRAPQLGVAAFLLPPMVQDIAGTYAQVAIVMAAETLRLARLHATRMAEVLNTGQDAVTLEVPLGPDGLEAALRETPFPSAAQGNQPSALAAAWWLRQGQALSAKVEDQIRAGLLAQESVVDLARRITGTPAQHGKDGVMAQALRSADLVARAQASMALTQAMEAVVAANPDGVAYLEHESTLDERTTQECEDRDGCRFDAVTHEPIGHDLPYLSGVPYHPHCRSMIRPVLVGEEAEND